MLEGGLTRAERTLQGHVGDEPVVELRLQLQAAMRSAIVDAVTAILGREVRSFMSANDPSQNLQAEIIVLADDPDPKLSSPKEELAARRRQAMETTRSLREDHAALMAEQAQAFKSLRRRAEPPPEP